MEGRNLSGMLIFYVQGMGFQESDLEVTLEVVEVPEYLPLHYVKFHLMFPLSNVIRFAGAAE